MKRINLKKMLLSCSVALLCVAATPKVFADYEMQKGTPAIKHAGPLAFGPDGILLVGDSASAAVFAIDTADASEGQVGEVNIEKINLKIAAMVGSSPQETIINDMAVNPLSGNVYFSVSRGRGPDAIALLFRTNKKGSVEEVDLQNVSFSKTELANAPENGKDRRGRNPRMNAITDVQYSDGRVIIAGLSNEEFASKLRVVNFPFNGDASATSVEVFHGAHGRLETNSPVRTFVTYKDTVLAAYTCTPLVTIPVEDLNGEKIMGKTIAELGNRNQPLDMIIYRKGDQDYLLMANNARGVMKLKLSNEGLQSVEAINAKVSGTAGLPYETMSQFEGVVQLDKLDSLHAVMLVSNASDFDLKTVALP